MDIRHGLISADSHVVTEPKAFLDRMSESTFGDRIPQIKEVENNGQWVERWCVNGKPLRTRGVCNCPAVMGDPKRNLQRAPSTTRRGLRRRRRDMDDGPFYARGHAVRNMIPSAR